MGRAARHARHTRPAGADLLSLAETLDRFPSPTTRRAERARWLRARNLTFWSFDIECCIWTDVLEALRAESDRLPRATIKLPMADL